MINDIISGISAALDTEFGDGYTIYTEYVEQGMNTPGFYIDCLAPGREKVSLGMYADTMNFDIHYFPQGANVKGDCYETGARLMDCMMRIALSDGTLMDGKAMSFSIKGDVLHFLVSYKTLRRAIPRADEQMETITTSIKEK
jgi:hypothetical protein